MLHHALEQLRIVGHADPGEVGEEAQPVVTDGVGDEHTSLRQWEVDREVQKI